MGSDSREGVGWTSSGIVAQAKLPRQSAGISSSRELGIAM